MAIIKPNNNTISAITALPAAIPTGKILQIVTTSFTSTQDTSGEDSFHDIPNLNTSITPSATSSKILLSGHVMGSSQNASAACRVMINLLRDSTTIGANGTTSDRVECHNASYSDDGANAATIPINFIDSPSSTSAITYKVQILTDNGAGIRVNAAPGDSNNNAYPRAISTLTLMEIAG
jgi:hypothetical protein